MFPLTSQQTLFQSQTDKIFRNRAFFKGIRPAVNVGLSVSRVGSAAQIKAMKQVSGSIKLDLAQFREMEAFSQFASDLDQSTRNLLERGRRLTEILKQPQYSPLKVEEQVVVIFAGVKGFLDKIDINKITQFETFLLSTLRSKEKKLLESIANEQALSETIEKKINDFLESLTKKFIEDN